ncbi:pyridoxamine 5'-phosphate oxidase family protein [Actinopolymorpha sp. B9G3]|uniref:pyridoxamine 5'-phosphate oxidase family protein n=1 Tax=Actinopolymorpha sp. B9G3 TaxID=3158970 RepID=UPI0032D94621
MYETADELHDLQTLLDTSLPRSSEHLRSIVTPGERTLTASQLTSVLTGMCTLSVATVTARGEPRISGLDGHFLHGRWVFSTAGTAVKVRHLRARPAVSVAHLRGDDLGVFVHGTAEFVPQDHPDWRAIEDHLAAHYGSSPTSWGDDIVYLRVAPHWMVAYAFQPAKLLADVANGDA